MPPERMNPKWLQRIGVLALIVLVGGSLAALFVVKDRIHVTIAEEEAAAQRGPDPISVLAADVGAVREDVRTLGDGVGTEMQALHDALEGAAGERESKLSTEVAALRAELAAVRARLEQNTADLANSRAQVGQSLTAVSQGLQVLAEAVAQDSAVREAARAAAIAPIVLAEPVPAEPAPAAVAVEPVPAPVEPAPEAAPKKGFLSFKVPSQGFAFDKLQRFAIVPSLSRVGFDAKSTLHDFSGVTTSLLGEITANLARPGEGCAGAVIAQSASIDTGLEARDESMREILEPKKFPEIRFDWTSFEATSVDAAGQKVAGLAKGKLSLHGISRDVQMPVTVAVDGSKRLAIDGQTKIKMSDYGVKPPSKLGLISVEDEATLWIALRARTLGLAGAEKP